MVSMDAEHHEKELPFPTDDICCLTLSSLFVVLGQCMLMKLGKTGTCQQQGQCRVACGFETEDVVQTVHMTIF